MLRYMRFNSNNSANSQILGLKATIVFLLILSVESGLERSAYIREYCQASFIMLRNFKYLRLEIESGIIPSNLLFTKLSPIIYPFTLQVTPIQTLIHGSSRSQLVF